MSCTEPKYSMYSYVLVKMPSGKRVRGQIGRIDYPVIATDPVEQAGMYYSIWIKDEEKWVYAYEEQLEVGLFS